MGETSLISHIKGPKNLANYQPISTFFKQEAAVQEPTSLSSNSLSLSQQVCIQDGYSTGWILCRMDTIQDRYYTGWILCRMDTIQDGYYTGWIRGRVNMGTKNSVPGSQVILVGTFLKRCFVTVTSQFNFRLALSNWHIHFKIELADDMKKAAR